MNKRVLILVLILKSFDVFGSFVGFKNLFINFYYNNQNKLGSFYENKVKEHPYITLAAGIGLTYGTYKFYNFFNKKPINEMITKENLKLVEEYIKNVKEEYIKNVKNDKEILNKYNNQKYLFFNLYNVPENTNLSFNGKGYNFNWEKILKIYDYKGNDEFKKKEENKLENGFKVSKYIAFGLGRKNILKKYKKKYKKKLDAIPRYKKVDLNNLDDLL